MAYGGMKFCPKCGTRLELVHKKTEKSSKPMLVCPRCGYETEPGESYAIPLKKSIHKPQEKIAIISRREQELRTLPTIKIECPRCGNNLAYVWQVQTRSSDESSTQFFRCTKCGYTFREYG